MSDNPMPEVDEPTPVQTEEPSPPPEPMTIHILHAVEYILDEGTGKYVVNPDQTITAESDMTHLIDAEEPPPEGGEGEPPPEEPVVDNTLPPPEPVIDNTLPPDQPVIDNTLPPPEPVVDNTLPEPEQPPA